MVAESLENAEDDAHEMLCDQNADNYRGLDSDRDTIKEVETIVKIFPNLLSKRKETKWDYNGEPGWIAAEEGEGEYPIQCLLDLYGPNGYRYNLKALPFVATLAQLGKDLDQFEDEEERGGLLCEDENRQNTLKNLATMYYSSDEEEHNRRMDTLCLSQFVQLQRMGLFKLDDITKYNLVHNLCFQDYFAERRFQFLVEWNPSSLVQTDENGCLPLHMCSIIEGFRTVFEYIIRYYPTKKGISSLFTKNNKGETAFQMAFQNYGREVVMRIVEDTLNNSVIHLNIVEAVVTAAIDGNVHLDCVYFLLRREPHVWVRLLSERHNNNNGGGGGSGGDGGVNYNHGNDVVDDDDGDNDDDNGADYSDSDNDSDGDIVDSKNNGAGTRKRKRNVGSIDA